MKRDEKCVSFTKRVPRPIGYYNYRRVVLQMGSVASEAGLTYRDRDRETDRDTSGETETDR